MIEASDSAATGGTSAAELGEVQAQAASFSWKRVGLATFVAALVVAPTVIALDQYNQLKKEQLCNIPVRGSGSRLIEAFDLSNAVVPPAEIRSGGPPKDGIPALSDPEFIPADEATYLKPTDRVVGVVLGNEARAYPIAILNHHEIVNDTVGEQPIAVTYCPLCDSAAVFDRRTPVGVREFGVSGLLYNSNVLMYDRDEGTESLWSQLKNQSVAGPQVGNQLTMLPLELATWCDWLRRHPTTKVLLNKTIYSRDYSRNPYASYFASSELMFPVQPRNNRLPAKERVLGIMSGEQTCAYPRSAFSAQRTKVEAVLDGNHLVIEFDPTNDTLRVVESDPGISWLYSFWFSWYAMHPETEVFE